MADDTRPTDAASNARLHISEAPGRPAAWDELWRLLCAAIAEDLAQTDAAHDGTDGRELSS